MAIFIRRDIYHPMQDIHLAAGRHLVLPLHNDATTPTLAFGDGNTGFYEESDNVIHWSIAGSAEGKFLNGGIGGISNYTGYMRTTVVSSSISPSFAFTADTDTGIGRAAANQLSLIAGGVEGLRITTLGGVANMDIVCHEGEVVTHNDNVVTLN